MGEIVTLSFIMPIMNICFLFCEFHFLRIYGRDIKRKFINYGVLTIFFGVFGFVMATFSLNFYQAICFQYSIPMTIFFLDGRRRGYYMFLLVPITILLSLLANDLFSVKVLIVIFAEALGTIVFCELIRSLRELDVFAKYATSMVVMNIITPIDSQHQWNIVLTDRLADISLPIMVGSIIIVLLVCAYVKAMREKAATVNKLEYQTNHDNLTSLLNYRAFSNYVIQIAADSLTEYTVLMIDLDNFKRINDQFGHLEGNRLLKDFSARLSSFFEVKYQTTIKIFRFGGEEFCLVFKNVAIDDAYQVIWQFEDSLTVEKYTTNTGQQVVISFSGGIARADQENNIHEAIRNADAAVYLAKSNGRAQIICPDCSID